jgi:hypothetical protein
MSILGRIGNVAETLLGEELKRQEKQREEGELYRRQKALQESGIINTMAQQIGPLIAAGKKVDYSAFPPELQSVLKGYEAAAPSEQERTGLLVGDWGKADKSEKVPGREEIIAQLQGKGVDTNDQIDWSRHQFSDENGTYGDEEGLLPAFTRGDRMKENPLVTQATTAAGSIRGRLSDAEQLQRRQHMEDEAATKLLPGRPKVKGVIPISADNKPAGQPYLLDPSTGKTVEATKENIAAIQQHSDIEWETKQPQQPSYASIYSSAEPMTPDEAKYWAQRVVETGSWQGLPPMGGPAGMRNQKMVESLVPHYHTGTGWDATTPGGATAPDQSLATNKMDYDAGHRTVGELTSNIAALNSYEESAKKNGALLKTVASQIPAAQWPAFIATPIRDIARVWGDPVMRQFEVYRQSVSKEYGRITTQPTLKGVFSVQGMLDANATMPDNATAGGLMAAVDAFDKEAHNRQSSYLEELERQRKGAVAGGAGGANRLNAAPVTPAHRPGVVRR